jgi:hypothetical protein
MRFGASARLLPAFRRSWLNLITCLFTMFHATKPSSSVSCKTDVLQVAHFYIGFFAIFDMLVW